ncbi:TPA: type II secretion system protein GspE, partial [Yersinia enterocolitica]
SSSLLAVLSQRLVRKLCTECRKQYDSPHAILQELIGPENISTDRYGFSAIGCDKCNTVGYRGRIALHELLIIDTHLREAIYKEKSELDLNQLARKYTRSIEQDGIEKVIAGFTTIEEVMRINLEEKYDCI